MSCKFDVMYSFFTNLLCIVPILVYVQPKLDDVMYLYVNLYPNAWCHEIPYPLFVWRHLWTALYLHKKSSSPLFNDCLIRMKFAMCKVRIYNTSVWRLRRGSDECRFGQKSCSLSTRHVEESFAHASVALDAHAGTRQPSPTGQLVHVLEERETKLI